MRPDVIRYILQYRATYTREAITRQLVAAGHEPAAIEAIWQAIERNELPPPPPGEPAYELPDVTPAQPAEHITPSETVVSVQPLEPIEPASPSQPDEPRAAVTPAQPVAPTGPTASTAAAGPIAPRPLVPPRPGSSPSLRSGLFWAVLIGYVLGVYVLSSLAAAATATNSGLEGVGGPVVFGLLWLAGLIGGLVLRGSNRPLSSGLLAGIVAVILLPVALGFIGLVIVAGICLVALSSSN